MTRRLSSGPASILPILAAFLTALPLFSCGSSGGTDGLAFDVRFSGDFCGGGFQEQVVAEDAVISLITDGPDWIAVVVHDGEIFDPESEAGWAAYTATNDVYVVIGFRDSASIDPPPVIDDVVRRLRGGGAIQTVEIREIFDSLFGGRDVGLIGLDDTTGPFVVERLDPRREEIRATFALEVFATADYPPDFSDFSSPCDGTLSGVIQGPYREIDVADLFP